VRSSVGGRAPRDLGVPGLELLSLPAGSDVDAAVKALRARPDVLYAEPNLRYAISGSPNDPYFSSLWGLNNYGQTVRYRTGTSDADIDAPEAWAETTGTNTLVAIVDTGVDFTHPDLSPNLWTNPGETGTDANGHDRRTNGVDDDGSGRIDDWRGWDFADGDNNPTDGHGHGTHVSGTVAARGNNSLGVTGVSWTARVMPLRVLDDNGIGYDSDITAAFAYAARMGAKVVNASLGGSGYSSAMRDAIAQASNTLFVFAAGNSSSDNDVDPTYPCSYSPANIVCVAATDSNDDLASFSNYGRSSVDIGAPGLDILSTLSVVDGGSYGYMSGTSMASPHVAGAAALVWAERPEATVAQVRQSLVGGAEPVSSLGGNITGSGGRLNLLGAVNKIIALVPSGVAFATPSTLNGPVNLTFENDVRGVTTSNLLWRVKGSSGGVAAALSCRDGGGASVGCITGPVHSATLTPPGTLLPGQWYTLTVSPVGVAPVTKMDSTALGTIVKTFRAATMVQEEGPGTSYVWRSVVAAGAFGGSYASARLGGASASWTGVGDSITWWTVAGPDQGVASVYVDDSYRGTYNLYSANRRFGRGYTFRYLTPGVAHTIKVVAQGTKGYATATDTQVSIDAFSAGSARNDQPSLKVAWQAISAASASAGRYVRETLAGGGAWFNFRGTGADWYTVSGPGMGRAAIYIDGRYLRTVDSYGAATHYGVRWMVRGLSDTVHSLRVVPLGQKRSASTGTIVAIDKFVAV
jgi:subtilisin family serine protease